MADKGLKARAEHLVNTYEALELPKELGEAQKVVNEWMETNAHPFTPGGMAFNVVMLGRMVRRVGWCARQRFMQVAPLEYRKELVAVAEEMGCKFELELLKGMEKVEVKEG